MGLAIEIEIPVRPFSINAERSEHRMKRAKRAKDVREEARLVVVRALAARGIERRPVLPRARIDVLPFALDRRYRQDVANCLPTAKACIDGFVDAELLADDRDSYLVSITFHPHSYGRDAMRFVVSEVGEEGCP